MAKLIIVRGLPGSGKSTYAKTLDPYVHAEADQYFTTLAGDYFFNPDKIGKAHAWCQAKVFRALHDDEYCIVVSNTFTQLWELQPYLDLAEEYDAEVEIHKCVGEFQNVHGAPPEAVERMRARWEDVEGEITVALQCNAEEN